MTTLLPELVYLNGEFRSGYRVSFDQGRLTEVGPAPPGLAGQQLLRRALLPGLINTHSHAFQRAIRARTEFRDPARSSDDFWSWRERMYGAASQLTPAALEAVSRMAFMEMLLAGVTSVGEFHYLHHRPDGSAHEDPDEMAMRVTRAADQVGLRMVLLRVGYARSGFEEPVNPRQARFIDPSPQAYLEAIERLRARGLRVGVAPHSVRACPLNWLQELGEYARSQRLPLHMHVAEQPREVQACLAEHGLRPVQLLAREQMLNKQFTGVHAIHLAPDEIQALGRARATVCSCPTTERNLGDGIVSARELLNSGCRLALGSDSQCQIDPWEDARQLEYHLRLQQLERAVLDPLEGPGGMGRRLLGCATLQGARSLGLDAGALAVGQLADMLAVDLGDPSLAGASRQELPDAIIFAMQRSAVREVWVGGRQVIKAGRHRSQEQVVSQFIQVMEELRAQE